MIVFSYEFKMSFVFKVDVALFTNELVASILFLFQAITMATTHELQP